MLGEVRDGLRLIWSDRRLRVVVLVIAILDFGFAGPTTAGVPLLAAEQGWGPGGIGWVLGGFGVGAVLTAAVLAWRRRRHVTDVPRWVLTAVAMVATALVARARAAVLRPWVVRLYVVFAGFFVLVTAWVLLEVALHSGMLPFTGLDALG